MRWTIVVVLGFGLVSLVTAQEGEKTATVSVKLPADAVLLVEGYKTTQTGTTRILETPALAPGKEYTYTLKATWTEGGKEVTRTKEVTVKAGGTFEVDFTAKEVPPPPKPGTFELKALPDVTLLGGEKKTLSVEVKRDNLKEPIQLTATGLPEKVTLGSATIAADAEKTSIELVVAKDAPTGSHEVTVTGKSGAVSREVKFRLRIEKSPEKPAGELKIEGIPDLSVEAGSEVPLELRLKTAHLEKPVEITFVNLPEGVTIAAMTVPADGTTAKTRVKASATSAARAVKIKALAASGTTKTEVEFMLAVKAKPVEVKPAALKVEAPARVELETGATQDVTVKIRRENFEGPVVLAFETGGEPTRLTIPAAKNEGVYTIPLLKEGETPVQVTATADALKATTRMVVVVKAVVKPPPPKPMGSLKLALPETLTLATGGPAKLLPIRVTRSEYDGPVEIAFSGVPEGVTLGPITLAKDKGVVYIEATASGAREGETDVTVKATGGANSTSFTLKVVVKK